MLSFYLLMIDDEKEKDIFSVIYENLRGDMYNVAFEVLGDEGLAEDAVHDAFLYAAKNIHKFSDPLSASTRAYMLMTAFSRAKGIQMKRREIVDGESAETAEPDSAEEQYFEKYDAAELAECIKTLDDKYKIPLLLKYSDEKKGAEIAQIMGISEETVRKRIERAKKMLRQMLEDKISV